MSENVIVINQFLETNFVDFYIWNKKSDGKMFMLEMEQGIPLATMYDLIGKRQNAYIINKVEFVEFDEHENEVARREIVLR